MKPPAIFLVGEVVRLREQLQWFDNKPLFGKTVIVTRARAQASALTKKLEAQGAKVIEAPAIKIVPAADTLRWTTLLPISMTTNGLSSPVANGVDYFFERLGAAKKDARALANVTLAAIGSATAKLWQNTASPPTSFLPLIKQKSWLKLLPAKSPPVTKSCWHVLRLHAKYCPNLCAKSAPSLTS